MFRQQAKRQKRKKGKTRSPQKTEDPFGRFINFPSLIHGIAKISHENTTPMLQQAVIKAFYNLNEFKDAYPLSIADHAGTYNGEIAFEVGIADGTAFNYLDQETLQEAYNHSKTDETTVLDFLVIVTYRYLRDGKKISLNFDHYILRFSFYNKEVETSLFHSKGTRRMPLDELMNLVIRRITKEVEQLDLKPIKVESLRTLV